MKRPVRTVLLAGLAMSVLAVGRGAVAEEFGAEHARALIPEAAGVEPDRYLRLAQLGAVYTEADVLAGGSVPLTLAIAFLRPWQPTGDEPRDAERARDFRSAFGGILTPTDLLQEVDGSKVGAGSHARSYASLLRPEHIRDVTCEGRDGEAHGTVSFRSVTTHETLGPLYGGRVEWTARKGAKGWSIEEFRLPGCRFEVRRVDGVWTPVDRTRPGLPIRIHSLPFLETPTADLVHVEASEGLEAAPRPLTFALTRDGGLFDGHGEMPELARLASTFAIYRSSADVLLRVHRDVPWEPVAWILEMLAVPSVGVPRVFFAVRADGPGEEGLVSGLPPAKDRPKGGVPAVPVRLKVDARTATDDAALAFLRAHVARDPDATAEVRPEPGVPAGHVLRTVSWLRSAGVRRIAFAAASVPVVPASREGSEAREYVSAHPADERGFSLVVGEATLVGKN